MKRIRSIPLYRYLLEGGYLAQSDEVIAMAKKQYRRDYKRRWKKNKRNLKTEIRITFSKTELIHIRSRASQLKTNPTDFARQAVIASSKQEFIIPGRETLQSILQKISMSAIILENEASNSTQGNELQDASQYLQEGEKLLMEYLGHGA